MPMIDEIANDAATLSLGTVGTGIVGTNLFTHHMPPTPDACYSFHQFALAPPLLVMSGATVCESLGLQVQARATDDPTAEANSYAVFNWLNGRANVTIGGTRYYGITGRKSPQKLRIDDDGRSIFYCEFTVLKAIS